MQKIRFVEYIRQCIDSGDVVAAEAERWYNDGAWYMNDIYKVSIWTKKLTRKKVVYLMRKNPEKGWYEVLNYTPEERLMLLELLPKALEVMKIKSKQFAEQRRKEREALEWWP